VICTAKRSNGQPCKAQAIKGGKVCRSHGGAAPQVRDAARQRILAAADPVAARLISIALNKKTKHPDAIAAARDVLNRAGVTAIMSTIGSAEDGGQVLWEEFIQIHRKRVPDAPGG
jgi:hypothetical protein